MLNRVILDQHPSVQDLTVTTGGINPAKAARHAMVINATPIQHDFERMGPARGPGRGAKGQVVTAFRNDDAIRAAAFRPPPSDVASAAAKAATAAAAKEKDKRDAAAAAAAAAPAGRSGGLPPLAGGASSRPRLLQPTYRAPSIVSTVFSVDAAAAAAHGHKNSDHSDRASSFSVYSCSCCHAAPPSSVLTGTTVRSEAHAAAGARGGTAAAAAPQPQRLGAANAGLPRRAASAVSAASASRSVATADYDNLDSISQRIAPSERSAGRGSGASVSVAQLRALETELARERVDRERTQQELAAIRDRQMLLLSKLSERERNALNAMVGA